MVKNLKFVQKSKIWSKIKIFVKNRKFGQKSRFWFNNNYQNPKKVQDHLKTCTKIWIEEEPAEKLEMPKLKIPEKLKKSKLAVQQPVTETPPEIGKIQVKVQPKEVPEEKVAEAPKDTKKMTPFFRTSVLNLTP